jgi:hypothetical protein
MKKFMKSHMGEINKIVNDLPNEFDSHEFIRKFTKRYQIGYVKSLSKYKRAPFKKVHAQIASFLSKNETSLNIKKTEKIRSPNIFGINEENQGWIKPN